MPNKYEILCLALQRSSYLVGMLIIDLLNILGKYVTNKIAFLKKLNIWSPIK